MDFTLPNKVFFWPWKMAVYPPPRPSWLGGGEQNLKKHLKKFFARFARGFMLKNFFARDWYSKISHPKACTRPENSGLRRMHVTYVVTRILEDVINAHVLNRWFFISESRFIQVCNRLKDTRSRDVLRIAKRSECDPVLPHLRFTALLLGGKLVLKPKWEAC